MKPLIIDGMLAEPDGPHAAANMEINTSVAKKAPNDTLGTVVESSSETKWPFARLDEYEISLVRANTLLARNPLVRAIAVVVNHLGNGWILPLVGVALLYGIGLSAVPVLFTAFLCVGIAHLVYPMIKRAVARPRPIDFDHTLDSLLPPLDLYSCPSGHCMTAMALFIPIVSSIPNAMFACSIAWLLIGWARLATAHHYPSDLVLGGLLGAVVTWPITVAVL
jgi:undecaprenyl-diphosphatase